MPDLLTTYKIFIASPGDTMAEREISAGMCNTMSRNPLIRAKHISLECLRWENVMPPGTMPPAAWRSS